MSPASSSLDSEGLCICVTLVPGPLGARSRPRKAAMVLMGLSVPLVCHCAPISDSATTSGCASSTPIPWTAQVCCLAGEESRPPVLRGMIPDCIAWTSAPRWLQTRSARVVDAGRFASLTIAVIITLP
jgi:hypothetical protein